MAATRPQYRRRAVLPPTARQLEVLAAIRALTAALGYPPTRRELTDALGLRSCKGVAVKLGALRDRGLVQWAPGLSRTLRVIDK